MAVDKRHTHIQNPDRDCTTSVTIHLPNSSANETLNDNILNRHLHRDPSQIHLHHHPHHHVCHQGNNEQHPQVDLNNNLDSNNNNIDDVHINGSLDILDVCHHQAATRSLLPDNIAEISISTESEDAPTPPPNYHEIPGIVPSYQGRTSGPPPSYDEVVNPNAPPPSYNSLFGQAREARKTSNGLVDLFRQLFLILIGTLGCTMIIGFLLLIPITMILVGLVYVNQCRAENIPSFLVIGGLVWIVKNVLNCYNQFKKDSTTANRPPPRRTPVSSANLSNRTNNTSALINQSSNVILSNQSSSTSLGNNDNINGAIQAASHIRIINSTSSNSANDSNTAQSIHPNGSSTTRMRTHIGSRETQSNSRIRNPSLIGITSFKCESMLNYFLIVWFLAGCIVVYRIYEPDYDNPLSASYCNRTVYLYAFWLMTSACITMAVVLSCLCCLMVSSLISCNHGR